MKDKTCLIRKSSRQTIRLLAALVAIALALPMAACVTKPAREEKRPNILFAFADDQSWLHTGAFGDRIVKTPAFDRVAREGVLFSHSYTACPSCTASRGAVLTGQQIWRIEQAGVLYGSIPARLKLYPLMLEDAGYFVGYTGKGFLPGDYSNLGLKRYPMGKEFNGRLYESVPEGIDTRDYAANFQDFLAERPQNVPFCFWFGSTEPHRVYQDGIGRESGKQTADVKVPPFWPDTEIVRSDILDYYAEIEWFDAHLQRMLDKLEEIGELDNTLVVVTSDNGMPFPRAKTTLYDWGVRMPLAVRWGEKTPGGRRIDDFVSHTDFAPTFLEAAGLQVPAEMTGRSLLPLLFTDRQGRVDPARERVFTATERHTWCRPDGATYPVRAIRTYRHLYLRNYEPDRWPTGGPEFVSSNNTFHGDVDACPTKSFMVGSAERYPREYELCFGKRPAEELYEVGKDPGQVNNLAGKPEYAEIQEKLRSELEGYLRETGDPRREGKDPWQGYIYHQTDGYGARFNRLLHPLQ